MAELKAFPKGILLSCGIKDHDTVQIANLDPIQFHADLKDFQRASNGVFTDVYGPHSNLERSKLWYELAAIRGLWSDQWVIGGKFNVCKYENEMLLCTARSKAMKEFSNTILDLGLIDLPLLGAQYTWSRGESQVSRNYRYLITPE